MAYPEIEKELPMLRTEAQEKLEAKAEVEFEREKLRFERERLRTQADLQRTKRAQEKTKQVEASSTKQAEVDQMKCLLEAPNNERASIMQSVTREKTKQVVEKTKQIEATSSDKQTTEQMKHVSEAPNDKRATVMRVLSNNHKEISQHKKHRLEKCAKGFVKQVRRILPSRSLKEGEVSSLVSEGATIGYDFHNDHALVKVAHCGISPKNIDDCLLHGQDIGQENHCRHRYPDTNRFTDGTTLLCITKASLYDPATPTCIKSGWKEINGSFLLEDIPASDDEEGRQFYAKAANKSVEYVTHLEKENQRLRDDNGWLHQAEQRSRDDNHWLHQENKRLNNELAAQDSEIRQLRNDYYYDKAHPDNHERDDYYSNTPPKKRQMDEYPYTPVNKKQRY